LISFIRPTNFKSLSLTSKRKKKKKKKKKMAAPAALNAAFLLMGFSAEASAILADIDRENLVVGTLQYLDDKGIKVLCTSLCKPGGMID
jgi:hypothetical protein